ncbi:imidazole glycerol phosphate synthase subunit HisF [Flavobacterium sp. ZB4P13]|uniref:imidazole glycerol phosphate synthase subunit HisF n=1 Tax=Flavobacterium sp. ZB4P13 TaxID=3401728 RepID=UPI003AADDE0F
MKTVRIIPKLDIKGPNLVKGIHLEGLRVLGKPSDFAKYYYEQGADELMFMDVVASLYERNSLHDIISETAKSIFIPITVGGGIRSLNDIKSMLRIGADKISINTAAIKRPEFIREASEEFGSSTIVVSIEAIKNSDGKHYAFIDNGREFTGIEVIEWAKEVERLGAGEIVITSVDKEGTGKGVDVQLTKEISDSVSLPIIAHGGIGSMNDVEDLLESGIIDSIAIGSALHYEALKNFNLDLNNRKEGNVDFLLSGRNASNFKSFDLKDLKKHLHSKSIYCR